MIEDGAYLSISMEDYHSDHALGSTDLKNLLISPAHYWHEKNVGRKESASMILGTAYHKCILEGEEAFREKYLPKIHNGNSKEGRSEKTCAENEGKILLDQDTYDRILCAPEIIRQNEALKEAFTRGKPEVSVFWTRRDGIRCKARFDYLKSGAIVDLKTIANEKNMSLEKACYSAIAKYDYLLSAAWYLEASHHSGLSSRSNFVWIFCQTTGESEAYGIATNSLNNCILLQQQRIELAISRYKQALETFGKNTPWTGNQTELEELDFEKLPKWYFE